MPPETATLSSFSGLPNHAFATKVMKRQLGGRILLYQLKKKGAQKAFHVLLKSNTTSMEKKTEYYMLWRDPFSELLPRNEFQ
jgi:hypothetical protein